MAETRRPVGKRRKRATTGIGPSLRPSLPPLLPLLLALSLPSTTKGAVLRSVLPSAPAVERGV